MGLVILINAKSGGGKGLQFNKLLNHLRTVILEPLRIEEQIEENINPGDNLIIAGGDGTISLVIDGLLRLSLSHDVLLRIFPLGTGNDLARSLGIPLVQDAKRFVKMLEDPTPSKELLIPVWRYGKHHFVNYVSFGLDAKILVTVDRWRQLLPRSSYLNRLLYVSAGILCLQYRIRQPLILNTDKESLSMQGRCGVIVSNIPSYAGGRRIGESDVMATALTITPLRSFWDLARLILKGSLFHTPALPFTHATSLELCGHPLPVQRDGEVGEFNEGFIRLAGNVRIAI